MGKFKQDIIADEELIAHEFRKALDGLDHDFLDLSYHAKGFFHFQYARIVATIAGAIAGFKSVKRASGVGMGSGQ